MIRNGLYLGLQAVAVLPDMTAEGRGLYGRIVYLIYLKIKKYYVCDELVYKSLKCKNRFRNFSMVYMAIWQPPGITAYSV